VPPQVGGVPGDDDNVGGARPDLLLAARAQVGLAGLRRVNAPDIEAKRFPRRRQVGDLLQFLQFERGTCGPSPSPSASRGRSSHTTSYRPRAAATARGGRQTDAKRREKVRSRHRRLVPS